MKGKGVLAIALLLAAAHAFLAIIYASETPYRTQGILLGQRDSVTGAHAQIADIGNPDERQHANYVQNLLDGKGFPVLKPGIPDAGEHIEDHQPPLYYLASAGFAKLVGVSNVGNDGAVRLRWLNAIIGAGTVLGVFYLGFWGLGRSDVALGAAAVAASLPMNCALSGAISNDPLLFLICTWTLAVCALAIRQGWSLKLSVAAGVLVGLGLLTKTTALALVPILLVATLLPQKKRPTIAMTAAAAAAIVILAGPWLVRNQMVYGDPLALGVFKEAFTGTAQAKDLISGMGGSTYWKDMVGWWTARSFFGVFGYMDIWLNETGTPGGGKDIVYRLLLAIGLILIAAWVASFFRSDWKESRAVQIVNACFLVVVVLLFISFNKTYFQAQGRYLYPAIGPIAVALSSGCFVILKDRGKVAVAVLAGILLLVNVYAMAKLPTEFQKRMVNRSSASRNRTSTSSRTYIGNAITNVQTRNARQDKRNAI
jgi:4-amino-4-deoxy-L-arabinose transferase-like glycosyltransferase